MRPFARRVEPLDHAGARVQGERAVPSVAQSPSMQSVVSNVLAIGLMLCVGGLILAWYYAHIAARQSQAHEIALAATSHRAAGEMALPSLGTLAVPRPEAAAGQPPAGPAPQATAVLPDTVRSAASSTVDYSPSGLRNPPLAPASRASRRLSGAAFVRVPPGGAAEGVPAGVPGDAPAVAVADAGNAVMAPSAGRSVAPEGALGALLQGSPVAAVTARVLPTQRLLLPRGAFIDCTLETAIDSTLPGMTTCVTATDTFGVDGTVVLLERGTKLVGETRGQVQQGSTRVFVLWTEARTPTGIVVPLDSPTTDELGRSGLPGAVDRHFWERFGSALVISTIDGAVQAGVQAASRGNGAIIYNPSATQDVMTESLKGTLNIAPTVIKRNGDRIQVLVARDLDFRGVYELRHVRP